MPCVCGGCVAHVRERYIDSRAIRGTLNILTMSIGDMGISLNDLLKKVALPEEMLFALCV